MKRAFAREEDGGFGSGWDAMRDGDKSVLKVVGEVGEGSGDSPTAVSTPPSEH